MTKLEENKQPNEIKLLIYKLLSLNLKSFINNNNELILIPKTNLYFRLDNVETELDFKCKLLEWCSRDCVKGVSDYWQRRTRKMVNYLLNTNFTYNNFNMIYCRLGNCVKHKLTIEFINSNYDFQFSTDKYNLSIMILNY